MRVEETAVSRLIEDDLETLMHAHWKECATDHEAIPFDPDWNAARVMEHAGILRFFGLFDDGELVGYSVYEVAPHLHFRSTLHAFCQGIYVKPERRKGNAGAKLIVESERLLAARGAKKFTYCAPHASNLNKVLEKGGYASTETVYTKLVA